MTTYEVVVKPRAVKDLAVLSRADAARVVEGIAELGKGLSGDVKRLSNHQPEYRLRVGRYRVLFEVEAENVVVYRVLHRREAYR
ncbi:MAG: type II toxin-antitoxin system RelE/ParE family toxin [Deltaproteobacteria bacterium]|nr:type II toxin-antitoxin system RelE/ParE family toxin [Deltaproteobacteria bacterium]